MLEMIDYTIINHFLPTIILNEEETKVNSAIVRTHWGGQKVMFIETKISQRQKCHSSNTFNKQKNARAFMVFGHLPQQAFHIMWWDSLL